MVSARDADVSPRVKIQLAALRRYVSPQKAVAFSGALAGKRKSVWMVRYQTDFSWKVISEITEGMIQ